MNPDDLARTAAAQAAEVEQMEMEWLRVIAATDPGSPLYDAARAEYDQRQIEAAISRSMVQGDDTSALDFEWAGVLDDWEASEG